MTTKEQERKALEQIRKIVAGLGEDSYVATAFEGCFEDAEENIENDFALSMNGRWQDAEQKIEQYKAIRDELVEENKALKDRAEKAEQLFNDKVQQATKYYDAWQSAVETTQDNMALVNKKDARIADLENRIIKLKAKLYDLMVAEN